MSIRTAVLIHGAGGGGWEFDLWLPVFEKAGVRPVVFDLVPAKGGPESTTFDDYVEQVRAQVPRTGRFALIGASLGGILSLKVAEQARPAALVLVNSVPPAGVGPPNPSPPYPEIVRWANGPLEETRLAMPDSDEATIQKAWKRWRDESGTVLNAITKKIPVRKPACPTLVVIGAEDTDIRPTTSVALADWAKADVLRYAGMSHVGPLLGRRAPEVAGTIVQWLKSR
ncbi:MAG: alpha/beta hydrolase [Capsulimonadales bacterium]|nr:alpha/beta hydrolase [Capsulimonadales bacterium]